MPIACLGNIGQAALFCPLYRAIDLRHDAQPHLLWRLWLNLLWGAIAGYSLL